MKTNHTASRNSSPTLKELKALDKTFGNSKEFLAYASTRIGDSIYQCNMEFWLVPSHVENLGKGALKCITNTCKKNGSDIDRAIVQNMSNEIQNTMKNAIRSGKSLKVYEAFLQAYTEECFLYKLIDRLFQEEDWKGLEEWSPYIIILASAFLAIPDRWLNPNHSQVNKNIPATLYRGMQLTKEDFKEYDSSKNRFFLGTRLHRQPRVKALLKTLRKGKIMYKYYLRSTPVEMIPRISCSIWKESLPFLMSWKF